MATYVLSSDDGKTVRFQTSGTVKTEGKKQSGKLTNNPIEGGSNINDHFAKDPQQGTLSGVLIDGASSVATLESMVGRICSYTGSYAVRNIVITSLDFSTSSAVRNGFNFSLSWVQAQIVAAQYVPAGAVPMMSQQDQGKTSNEAVKKSGMPKSEGLQTAKPVQLSPKAHDDYINSFNKKPKPSEAPLTRQIATYSGV